MPSALRSIASFPPAQSTRTAPRPPAAEKAEHYLIQLSRPAMACEFAVFLNAGQYEQGFEAALAALDLVERIEAQLTVYRETSDVPRDQPRGGGTRHAGRASTI